VAPEAISGCVPCHGADGIARYGEVPILAGRNAPYLLNQLHAFQSGKRAHKEMRYMTRNLTEEGWKPSQLTSQAFRRGDMQRRWTDGPPM
jgi:cytochrome c553